MKTIYGDYANIVFDVMSTKKGYFGELLSIQSQVPVSCRKDYFAHYIQVWNKFLSIEWDGLNV